MGGKGGGEKNIRQIVIRAICPSFFHVWRSHHLLFLFLSLSSLFSYRLWEQWREPSTALPSSGPYLGHVRMKIGLCVRAQTLVLSLCVCSERKGTGIFSSTRKWLHYHPEGCGPPAKLAPLAKKNSRETISLPPSLSLLFSFILLYSSSLLSALL